MSEDRNKPPPGGHVQAGVDSNNLRDRTKWFWSFGDDGYADTETEAVAACWAHHDAIAERAISDWLEGKGMTPFSVGQMRAHAVGKQEGNAETLAAVVAGLREMYGSKASLRPQERADTITEAVKMVQALDTDNLVRQRDERIRDETWERFVSDPTYKKGIDDALREAEARGYARGKAEEPQFSMMRIEGRAKDGKEVAESWHVNQDWLESVKRESEARGIELAAERIGKFPHCEAPRRACEELAERRRKEDE